jgi:hypothetical protein
MSGMSGIFGLRKWLPPQWGDAREHIVVQHPLRRVLAFTGRSIDDVVNSPMVKREVLGFYKLHKWVQRGMDVSELERQWNSV